MREPLESTRAVIVWGGYRHCLDLLFSCRSWRRRGDALGCIGMHWDALRCTEMHYYYSDVPATVQVHRNNNNASQCNSKFDKTIVCFLHKSCLHQDAPRCTKMHYYVALCTDASQCILWDALRCIRTHWDALALAAYRATCSAGNPGTAVIYKPL